MPLYFGMFISLAAYQLGIQLKKRWKLAILNPLLAAIIVVIAFLKLTGIPYAKYNEGACYLSYFLTPATVCLVFLCINSLPC